MAFWQWSKTASNNGNSDPTINWQEGMPPALVNDSSRAGMARTAEYRDDTSGLLLTAGTATAYTVTTNQGLPATPNDGQLIVVSFHLINGANATLAADGGGAFAIQVQPGIALPSGLLDTNTPYPLRFRAASSSWVMFACGVATVANAANAGVITNFALATAPAWTIKGNPTGSTASPTDFTIPSLTAKPSPVAGDVFMIWDSVASALKSCNVFQIGKGFTAPSVQSFISGSGTYTPTTNTVRIKVRMVGGGGGGGAAATNNGSPGGSTSFGGWSCGPGGGGIAAGTGNGGAGGSGGTNGTGVLVGRFTGAAGGPGWANTGGSNSFGAAGGATPFGGAGAGTLGGAGGNAAVNTGSGGAGGATGNVAGAGGGGAGEYVEFWMTAAQVGASQTYTVGSGGSGGAAGTNAGGNGAAAVIIVEEFYV